MNLEPPNKGATPNTHNGLRKSEQRRGKGLASSPPIYLKGDDEGFLQS
jgi:hypothetical protein